MKLTKTTIDALPPVAGRKDALYFDDEVKGFGVRVTRRGSRIFVFQYRSGPRVRRLVLGELGPLTPAGARSKALVLRARVLEGRDPVTEAKTDKARAAAAETGPTATQVEALTLRDIIESWGTTGLAGRDDRYRAEATRALRAAFGTELSKPAASLDRARLVSGLDRLVQAGSLSAARHAHSYGRAMLNWAAGRASIPTNPLQGVPAPAPAGERDRVLSTIELGEAWRAALVLGWPFGPYLRLLILTLQRREEVAGMRWSELSPDRTTWTVPKERTKNGAAHIVHLAPEARRILAEVPRFAASDLVFTTNGVRPVSGYSAAARRLRESVAAEHTSNGRAGDGVDWVWHDFRRTGVTTLARLGFPPHVADKILNHRCGTISGVAAVYQRHEFPAERQEALLAWARHVAGAAELRGASTGPRTGVLVVVSAPTGLGR